MKFMSCHHQPYNILVIGGNHHNTLGVLRSLGQRGVCPDLLLVDSDHTYVAKSKYIDNLYICKDYDEALMCMQNTYRCKSEKTIIICTSDNAICMIDENLESLLDKYVLPGTNESGRISTYMNKNLMAQVAVEVGLKIPQAFSCIDGKLDDDITLPCIVKPLRSIDGTKGDIMVCNDRDDLQNYNATRSNNIPIQVQEYIERDYEYQLIGCSINGGQEVIVPGVSIIVSAASGSNTGYLKYDKLDSSYPIQECKSFIRNIGYSGLFSIEFIRSTNGIDYFMEINFRNDGNAICVTRSGVNLPYIWYLTCNGLPYSNEVNEITPLYVMPEFDELLRVFKRDISLITWLRELFNANAFMEFDIKDQKPYWGRLWYYGLLFFKKLFRIKVDKI